MQKKEEVKATVKATEAKVVEAAKTAKDATVTKATEAKEATKEATKAVAKKATAAKAATKTAAKKTVAKAAAKTSASKSQVIVQYQNNEVDVNKVEERVKAQFISEGHKASTIKKVNIYVKPEEYSAYYVINDKFSGRVDLF